MYSDGTLINYLQSSSSIQTKTKTVAEWNLNIFENISVIGNYKNRATSATDYTTIPSTYSYEDENNPVDKTARNWYGYTDYDTVIDGGYTDTSNIPVSFLNQNERQKSLMSLEDCFKKFRPRSGINKLRYSFRTSTAANGNNIVGTKLLIPVSGNQGSAFNIPRYYAASKDDNFKYWSSYRIKDTTEYGISSTSSPYLIKDASPFIVYKNQIPTNKIVMKIQTNVSKIDNGKYIDSASPANKDPFYINSTTNYKSTPLSWKIQALDSQNIWQDIYVTEKDQFTSDAGWDGYFELSYGLNNSQIIETYKNTFVLVGTLYSTSALPNIQGDAFIGQAYLVKSSNTDKGDIYIYNGGVSSTVLSNYDKVTPTYGWYRSTESITNSQLYVTELDKTLAPQYVDGKTVYREFQYINGLRIVVNSMANPSTTFDLIELSPRLSVDLSDMTSSLSIKKYASDLGVSSLPVGQLIASTGTMSIFDYNQVFNANNSNSLLNTYINDSLAFSFVNKNLQFKFYEIISKVQQKNGKYKDYYIPLKTLYADGFPQYDDSSRDMSINLRDLSLYFESQIAPEILLVNASTSFIVATLLDSIGFSNYKFLRNSSESDTVIPYFMVSPNRSIMQVLEDLAIATQTTMFFDELNNFVVMSKGYLIPETKSIRDSDITLYGYDLKSTIVNLLTYSNFASNLTGWDVGANSSYTRDTTKKYNDTASMKLSYSPTNLIVNPTFETNITGWSVVSGTISQSNTTAYAGTYSLKATTVKDNKILNPSFETNIDGYSADTNTLTLTRDTLQYYAGAASLKATSNDNSTYSFKSANIDITRNKSYTYTISAKTQSVSTTATLRLDWYDSSNAFISSSSGSTLPLNGTTWTQLSVTSTAPDSAKSVVLVATVTATTTSEETCYFDSAKLIDTNPTYTNLITNSGFETNIDGYNVGLGNPSISRDTTTFNSGSASLKVVSSDNSNYQIFTSVVAPNTFRATSNHTFSIYAKLVTIASTTASVKIEWFNSSNISLGSNTSSSITINKDSWTRLSVTSTTPSNAKKAILTVIINTSPTSKISEKCLFDDAFFGVGTAPTVLTDADALATAASGTGTEATVTVSSSTNLSGLVANDLIRVIKFPNFSSASASLGTYNTFSSFPTTATYTAYPVVLNSINGTIIKYNSTGKNATGKTAPASFGYISRNLLDDGTFEISSSTSKQFQAGNNTGTITNTGTARNGNAALSVISSSAGSVSSAGSKYSIYINNGNTNNIDITNQVGKKYKVSAYVKTSNITSCTITAEWYDATNTQIAGAVTQSTTINSANTWTQIQFSDIEAPKDAQRIRISIDANKTSSSSEYFYVDDVKLENISEVNLITNSEFTSNTDGWSADTNIKTFTIANSALAITCNSNTNYIVKTSNIAIDKGKQYIASVWTKAQGQIGKAAISIDWYNGNTYIPSSSETQISTSTSNWTQMSIIATAPDSATSAVIKLKSIKSIAGTENIFYDSLYFAEPADAISKFSITNKISTVAGNNYIFSIYGKTELSAVNSQITLDWYNDTKLIDSSSSTTEINQNGWTLVSASGTCPTNATSLLITITTSNPTSGTQNVFYDNAILSNAAYSTTTNSSNSLSVIPGKTYLTSIWALSETYDDSRAKLYIDWKSSTNELLSTSESDEFSINKTNWKNISINSSAPTNAKYAYLRIGITAKSNSAESVFLDAASFSEVSNSISNIINISSEQSDIYNDGKIVYYNRYIQKQTNDISTYSNLDKYQTISYKRLVLWALDAFEKPTQSKNEEDNNLSGFSLSAIPLATILSNKEPYVENGVIKNNIIEFNDGAYWLSRYQGHFYSNGEIIKYDAIEYMVGTGLDAGNKVWITSSSEYEKYFAQLTNGQKMYRTGNVRIYTEPVYDTNNIITSISKHGRAQFGTTIASHNSGDSLDSSWTTPQTPLVTDYQYLFSVKDNGDPLINATTTSNIVSQKSNLVGAKMSTPKTTIKNFLSVPQYNVKTKRAEIVDLLQASALVLNGPTFSLSTNNGPSLNYVKKDLETYSVAYDTFGTRVRILGSKNKQKNVQSPLSYFKAYDVDSSKDNIPSIINASSGGISVMTNADGEGYYLEIAALDYTSPKELTMKNSIVVNDMFFYKMTKNNNTDKILIPKILYSDFKNILVDSGKFTSKVVSALDTEDSVYDIAIKVNKVNDKAWHFSIYFDNNYIGTYTDNSPITSGVSTNMSLFVRGSSQLMFENVYALKTMTQKPSTKPAVSSEFFNGTMTDNITMNKYSLGPLVKSGFLSQISPSYIPENQIYYEEFGAIMRECYYFNVKFDKAYPALRSIPSQVPASLGGYLITGYTSTPYRAEFLIFNTTDFALDLGANNDYAQNLNITGISFTQESAKDLTVDDFFTNKTSYTTNTNYNINTYKNNYTNIKNNRLTYGLKSFTIDSPYIQSRDTAENLMDFIINKISKPRKAVAVETFGMSIIQLGDLVNFSYDTQKVLPNAITGNNYVVYGIEHQVSDSGPSTILYLSEVV